ncbi:High cysteine membrane protein [Giardia muris]|uniref:High cysteine membrane protein n=1 Tax=Giardia muris TaxID=5742 RepID=A0A4Z1SLK5_GIAMU|nr:High cysteine membrane protein [Giardia muris]|eukprot:TNJ26536.1 High cysteine membrane protein [Giardia muris]
MFLVCLELVLAYLALNCNANLEISTVDDLDLIRQCPGGTFHVTQDLLDIGVLEPFDAFTGQIFGQGHRFMGILLSQTSALSDTLALFQTFTGMLSQLVLDITILAEQTSLKNISGFALKGGSGLFTGVTIQVNINVSDCTQTISVGGAFCETQEVPSGLTVVGHIQLQRCSGVLGGVAAKLLTLPQQAFTDAIPYVSYLTADIDLALVEFDGVVGGIAGYSNRNLRSVTANVSLALSNTGQTNNPLTFGGIVGVLSASLVNVSTKLEGPGITRLRTGSILGGIVGVASFQQQQQVTLEGLRVQIKRMNVSASETNVVLGGIIGSATQVELTDCQTDLEDVIIDVAFGGIVCNASLAAVRRSIATYNNVTAVMRSTEYWGGLVGYLAALSTVENSNAFIRSLTIGLGSSTFGSLVGVLDSSNVLSSYSRVIYLRVDCKDATSTDSPVVGGLIGIILNTKSVVTFIQTSFMLCTNLTIINLDSATQLSLGGLVGQYDPMDTGIAASILKILNCWVGLRLGLDTTSTSTAIILGGIAGLFKSPCTMQGLKLILSFDSGKIDTFNPGKIGTIGGSLPNQMVISDAILIFTFITSPVWQGPLQYYGNDDFDTTTASVTGLYQQSVPGITTTDSTVFSQEDLKKNTTYDGGLSFGPSELWTWVQDDYPTLTALPYFESNDGKVDDTNLTVYSYPPCLLQSCWDYGQVWSVRSRGNLLLQRIINKCQINNCAQCDESNPRVCLRCIGGYSLGHPRDTCYRCDNACASCKQGGLLDSCISCADATHIFQNDACISVPANYRCDLDRCLSCSLASNNGCTSCVLGYYTDPSNSRCTSCSEHLQCLTCTNQTHCTACTNPTVQPLFGYCNYVSNSCSDAEFCQYCSSTERDRCLMCKYTNYTLTDEFKCVYTPLQTCNDPNCLNCDSDQEVCLECKERYYRMQDGACWPCPNDCLLCYGSELCAVCLSPNRLPLNWTCTYIDKCTDTACASCKSTSPDLCLKCKEGYALMSSTCVVSATPQAVQLYVLFVIHWSVLAGLVLVVTSTLLIARRWKVRWASRHLFAQTWRLGEEEMSL